MDVRARERDTTERQGNRDTERRKEPSLLPPPASRSEMEAVPAAENPTAAATAILLLLVLLVLVLVLSLVRLL